jgi:predicted O-linked N-acetylglucosamine transferase (SPINDLY family)
LPVFAWKPAPVQVAWLGYFASTGVKEIDYILCDARVLPESEAAHFVERPWRLPDCYLCFTPPHEDVEVGPLPLLENGYVTFGCFNKLSKMNDRVVGVWSRVLKAVPGSRLMLKAKELNDPVLRAATLTRFAAQGIDAGRLILSGYTPRAAYLAEYGRVDIALDPFPYPGGTTTVEALWMGVPVLSLRGERFLSHAGESLLGTAGLGDWVAADEDEYVAKAVAMTADGQGLSALRRGLRAQLLTSPLCDAARFAAHLGAAFEGMWAAYCERGDPTRGRHA